jgi:hypothetical protein
VGLVDREVLDEFLGAFRFDRLEAFERVKKLNDVSSSCIVANRSSIHIQPWPQSSSPKRLHRGDRAFLVTQFPSDERDVPIALKGSADEFER